MIDIDDRIKRTVNLVLAVVAVGALVSIFISWRNRHPRQRIADQGAMARIMTEEISKSLGGHGRVVLVTLDPSQFPATQLRVEGFTRALAQLEGFTELATESVKIQERSSMCSMPAARYFAILEKYPRATAIISFAGPPDFTEDDMARLPGNAPKLIIVSPCGINLELLSSRGLLHLAIQPRSAAPKTMQTSFKSAREEFDYYYLVVTPRPPTTAR